MTLSQKKLLGTVSYFLNLTSLFKEIFYVRNSFMIILDKT